MGPDEPVSRIMTETVVVIEADRPVREALDCFVQYPIHHLPVVSDGRPVGMVSSADVVKLESFVPEGAIDRAAYHDERLTLAQLMRSPIVSVRSSAIRSLLHGPPRESVVVPSLRTVTKPSSDDASAEPHYYRRPSDAEYATALGAAEVLHVEARDPRHVGKALLYLEKVLAPADRLLLTGHDEHVHALLLQAIHAARRVEEHATGRARVPFPLE